MNFNRLVFVAVICLAGLTPARAAAQGVEGTWKLTYLREGTVERSTLLVKLTVEDGKVKGEVLGERIKGKKQEPSSVAQVGDLLRIVTSNGQFVFEAPLVKMPGKKWLGAATSFRVYSYPAWLSPTTETRISPSSEERTHVCSPMQEAAALKGNSPEKSKLYRDVVEKHPDDPALFTAVLLLMASAEADKATLDDAKNWAAAADKLAKDYGPRMQTGFARQAASVLMSQEGFASLAVAYARRVDKSITLQTPLPEQIEILELLIQTLKRSRNNDEAKRVQARIDAINETLDTQYLASLPPVQEFSGRKNKGDRAVLLEEFANSRGGNNANEQACSMLRKTFKPGEVIVLQYHLYSDNNTAAKPGPLSSPDTTARIAYYKKAFPIEVPQLWASVFNGLPQKGIAKNDAQKSYEALRKVLEPLLEENGGASIAAKAVRKDDKIDIEVNVSGLAKANGDQKLRVVLAEEMIRHPVPARLGKEGVRLHDNVVRAFPGGVAGTPLTQADSKHRFTIDVGKLRDELTKYLADAKDENGRALKDTAPLLVLENLNVIAFVQDDGTREILQAVQVKVK